MYFDVHDLLFYDYQYWSVVESWYPIITIHVRWIDQQEVGGSACGVGNKRRLAMRLPLKKCIHLMVILLALIETFTGAIVDCVVYTIFYPSSLDHDGSSTSDYYFTAHLLPTKHFYRLIIVLYVPILYLWRSNGVCRLAEVSYNVSARSAYGSSRVISVICTRLPRSILPATAGWLWHWLRALQSTDADVQLADSSDADCNSWLRNPAWYENRKSWGALIHYSGQQHNSVIKQYNTRVCGIYFHCLL